MNIDNKDKMILTLLARNPYLSQVDIANEIGLTQSSVAVRIEKLKKNQIIETQIGINPLNMGLIIGKVDISTNNPSLILEMFKHCPFFINGFTVSGKDNLCLFFVSENVKAIEALVNHHIRSLEYVNEISFNLITDAKKNFIVPIKFIHENFSNPPCSDQNLCDDCNYFAAEEYKECPAIRANMDWQS